jgi:DNA-binding response OmpR family regulator
LQHEGYVLDSAANGAEALAKLAEAEPAYDLLLLDLQMEPIGGIQVLQAAHEQDPDVPVIILTAYSTLESALKALRLNAFDYLFKPAIPATIRQRVQAGLEKRRQLLSQRRFAAQINILRRMLAEVEIGEEALDFPTANEARFVRSGQLVIDRNRRHVTLAEVPLALTSTEYDLLDCLIKAAPEPLSAWELVRRVLGYDCSQQEAREIIKWHIHQLRRKIEPDPTCPQFIKTVRSRGYLWSGE